MFNWRQMLYLAAFLLIASPQLFAWHALDDKDLRNIIGQGVCPCSGTETKSCGGPMEPCVGGCMHVNGEGPLDGCRGMNNQRLNTNSYKECTGYNSSRNCEENGNINCGDNAYFTQGDPDSTACTQSYVINYKCKVASGGVFCIEPAKGYQCSSCGSGGGTFYGPNTKIIKVTHECFWDL